MNTKQIECLTEDEMLKVWETNTYLLEPKGGKKMENYVKEYLVIMYDAKMEAGYEHGYYDTEEEALNVAKELSETNHLTEKEAEHSFVSVEMWNEKDLSYNDTIARFACSWMRKFWVQCHYFESNGFSHCEDLDPLEFNKKNNANDFFVDYAISYMDNETVDGRMDYDFRFSLPTGHTHYPSILVASVYVETYEDGTYEVHPVEEY